MGWPSFIDVCELTFCVQDMGDEPGFRASFFTELSFLPSKNNVLVPTYLYNYVGQPTKTVDRVDAMLAMYYNTS